MHSTVLTDTQWIAPSASQRGNSLYIRRKSRRRVRYLVTRLLHLVTTEYVQLRLATHRILTYRAHGLPNGRRPEYQFHRSTATHELHFHPRVPMVITPRSTHAGVAQGPYTSPSCTAQPGLGYVKVKKVWGSVPGVVTCACAHVETASAHAGWRVLVGVHCNRQ